MSLPLLTSNRANPFDTKILLHLLDHLRDNRVHLSSAVTLALRPGGLQPLHDVEVSRAVEGDWVTLEEIGHHDEVAVGGELVGDAVSFLSTSCLLLLRVVGMVSLQLRIDELMTNDVRED